MEYLNRARRKGLDALGALGPITKSIVDGTVLYCTVQLYCTSTMPGSSQFYNIERFLMTGMESQICSSTEIAWDTPYTEDILLPEATLLIVLRLPRVRAARRSGLEQSGRQLQLPEQSGGQLQRLRREQSGQFRIWVRIRSWLVPES